MTKTLLITALCVFILLGISFLIFWIDKGFKKRAAKKFNDRFKYLDDYYNYYNEFEEV